MINNFSLTRRYSVSCSLPPPPQHHPHLPNLVTHSNLISSWWSQLTRAMKDRLSVAVCTSPPCWLLFDHLWVHHCYFLSRIVRKLAIKRLEYHLNTWKGRKNACVMWHHKTCKCPWYAPLSSDRTTLKRQLNGEKWNVGYLCLWFSKFSLFN